MKQILEPIETAYGICGDQKLQERTHYRRSRHCVSVECEEGTLLFHTLTGELLLIGKNEKEETIREQLVRRWFLVPDSFDECEQSDTVHRLAALLNPFEKNKNTFTILTTTDCNARCFYCYEKGIPRFSMNEKTAKDVGEYIARECGGKKVSLSWFGGEPLYNQEAIDIICTVLRDHGIAYSSILTSNGFYLDQLTAKKAVDAWHVRSVQITVDGTETVYNRTKAYINAEGSSFQRILRNIQNALDAGIHVSIRLNMDRQNAADLLELTEQIGQRYGRRPNLSAHVILLQGIAGEVHEFASDEEATFWTNQINKKLDEYGYLRAGSLPRGVRINHCIADNPSCEVILPDGRIQRCEHFDENEIVGNIYDETRNEEICRAWCEKVRFEKCTECELFPMCVPLKRCPWRVNGCSDYRRKYLYNKLSRLILSMYNENNYQEEENAL